MAEFKFYSAFFAAVFDEKHSIKVGGDTIKARLLTTALDPADDTWSDVSGDEVATGGGYTAGGVTCSVTSAAFSDGVFTVVIASPDWTASGGGFSFRSMVFLNDTAPSDELIGGVDYGRTLTVIAGESTKTLGYTKLNEISGTIILGGNVIT